MNISPSFASQLKHGARQTRNVAVAVEMARRTGRPAIEFISEHLRKEYAAAFPELAKRPKVNGNKKSKIIISG